MQKHYKSAKNGGFSLLIALLFVLAFASALASFTFGRQGENLRVAAEISGWQAAQLARAARIHVRNQMMIDSNLDTTLDLAGGGPQEIRVHDLIDLALLPQGFGHRINDNRYNNNLGQHMRVIMANHPVDGDPNDPRTVPTAYIYFENSEKSSPALIQDMVTAARLENVAVSAPLYNGNVNVTGDCNGLGDTVIAWDTGCLSNTEFNAITGDNFEIGSLMIPAWRSVRFDNRALMRFPQPEIAGALTMTTPLEMAIITACDTIQIPEDNGTGFTMEDSGICEASDDDAVANINVRHDLLNVNTLEMDSFLIDPQTTDDVRFNSTTGTSSIVTETNPAFITGNNATITGDAKVFQGDVTISRRLTVDDSIIVSNATGVSTSVDINGTMNGGDGFITDTITFDGQTIIGNDLGVTNTVENIPTTTIDNNMQVTNTVRVQNNILSINNGLSAGQLNVDDLTVSNDMTAANATSSNTLFASGHVNAIGATANVENNSRVTGQVSAYRQGSGRGRCTGSYCPRRRAHNSCVRSSTWLHEYTACMESRTGNTKNGAYKL